MTTLDWHYKGLPLDVGEIALADVAKHGWNVLRGDLPTPVMVLLRDPLADNIAAMAAWCAERDLLLAPHGKSTMAPQIFERQLAAGAWAMTCATPWHLRRSPKFERTSRSPRVFRLKSRTTFAPAISQIVMPGSMSNPPLIPLAAGAASHGAVNIATFSFFRAPRSRSRSTPGGAR